jgi:tetratricopeptide (TPR) repeat protein
MPIRFPRIALCLLFSAIPLSAQTLVPPDPADRLLDEGHYLRAEPLIRAALERNPSNAHALANLSILDWSLNRFDAAIADAEKAVSIAPNDPYAHSHLADALGAKLASSNAGTFEKLSLARRFRKEVDRTLQLDPNDADALQDLAQFYWNAPGFAGGDKAKARQTADRLFAVSPFRGASARASFASDESDPARRATAIVAIWRTAAAAKLGRNGSISDEYDTRASLAAALLEDTADPKHLPAAEHEADRARTLDPGRISAWNTLAAVYARTNRWEELDRLLKQSRAAVPDDRSPEFFAARAILIENNSGQLPRAETLLRSYLAQRPEAQAPSHAAAHWRLGLVLERQGRRSDAVHELQTALEQDSSLEAARKDLKRLS